jgi:glycosyltransferase involved in cell wall biosynthesis
MKPRICILTAGHLATCPRMLKAADALAGAGFQVRVVSTRYLAWATAADAALQATRPWKSVVIDYDRGSARTTYIRTGVRMRAAQMLVRAFGVERCPATLAARAYSRLHIELLQEALVAPADLFYGGTNGALAAIAAAGRRAHVPFALDLEDFHSAEQDDSPAARLAHRLAARIERDVLPRAAFLTASSDAIAAAYTEKYAVSPIPVHNTFPLPESPPDLTPHAGDGLQLYWFSQTIGPWRGLEDAVRAMGLAGIPGALHLRGASLPSYVGSLQRLARTVAPRLRIIVHEPAPPDTMIGSCRGYDVGLALEQGQVLNRALCLTNKAFTYMLGGLAVAFTDTLGQRPLARELGEGAILYTPGDVGALADGLARWARDKTALVRAKHAAWEAARRRWHWEHPAERGALLAAVARALGKQA